MGSKRKLILTIKNKKKYRIDAIQIRQLYHFVKGHPAINNAGVEMTDLQMVGRLNHIIQSGNLTREQSLDYHHLITTRTNRD